MGKALTQAAIDVLVAANAAYESEGMTMEACCERFDLPRYALTNYRRLRRTTPVEKHLKETSQIDLMLEILMTILDGEPVELSQVELADICGCTQAAIYCIEKRAIEKLQKAARRKGC